MIPWKSSSPSAEDFDWQRTAYYYQPLSTAMSEDGWPVQLAASLRRERNADGSEAFVFEPAFAVLIDRRDGIGRIAAPELIDAPRPLAPRSYVC